MSLGIGVGSIDSELDMYPHFAPQNIRLPASRNRILLVSVPSFHNVLCWVSSIFNLSIWEYLEYLDRIHDTLSSTENLPIYLHFALSSSFTFSPNLRIWINHLFKFSNDLNRKNSFVHYFGRRHTFCCTFCNESISNIVGGVYYLCPR